ncbi:VP4 [Gokushovirus WZ-2015a]|nr:VP4 [Gokushovirus WZ-2015a]
MSCYHPLRAWPIGTWPSGKPRYHVTADLTSPPHPGEVLVPCGKCIGCRLDYSREWANRCMCEAQYHDSSYFVTLTYDDIHVPRSWYSDPSTGEAYQALTLRKRDYTLFMKRLRRHFENDKIRFFAAGEYGSITYRPHYHAILFGLHLDDLVPYKQQGEFIYYTSESLQRCWSVVQYSKGSKTPLFEPLGFVVVAPVSWETCAYVARYTAKKSNTFFPEFYKKFNLEAPFTVMSRKPGIGRQYYEDHKDVFDYQNICLPGKNGGLKFKPPRYFEKLLEVDQPDKLEELKESRRMMAEDMEKAKKRLTSLYRIEQSAVDERKKEAQARMLRREL